MPRAQSQKPRGIIISRADQDAIEAATPGWCWSNGYRAPDNIRRRGEGTHIIGWAVFSAVGQVQVVVRETNGRQIIRTLAKYTVPSTELPALARKLLSEYHQ